MDFIIESKDTEQLLAKAHELGERSVVLIAENTTTTKGVKTARFVKHVKDIARLKGLCDTLVAQATREMIEAKGIEYVYGAESVQEKDKTHHRGSGLNQVLARLMAQNGKTYVFDLRLIMQPHHRAMLLGRMSQNKRLLEKYGVSMMVASFAQEPLELRAPKERELFLRTL